MEIVAVNVDGNRRNATKWMRIEAWKYKEDESEICLQESKSFQGLKLYLPVKICTYLRFGKQDTIIGLK